MNGELFATNLGAGFGTRDALFVLMLMELIQRFGLPDVDFVLYTEVVLTSSAHLPPIRVFEMGDRCADVYAFKSKFYVHTHTQATSTRVCCFALIDMLLISLSALFISHAHLILVSCLFFSYKPTVSCQTKDRARLAREAYPRRKGARGALPFALSFARHDEFLDVGVPVR